MSKQKVYEDDSKEYSENEWNNHKGKTNVFIITRRLFTALIMWQASASIFLQSSSTPLQFYQQAVGHTHHYVIFLMQFTMRVVEWQKIKSFIQISDCSSCNCQVMHVSGKRSSSLDSQWCHRSRTRHDNHRLSRTTTYRWELANRNGVE